MTLFEKRAREEVAFWEKFIEDWRNGMGGEPPERMHEALAWARERLARAECAGRPKTVESPLCREAASPISRGRPA